MYIYTSIFFFAFLFYFSNESFQFNVYFDFIRIVFYFDVFDCVVRWLADPLEDVFHWQEVVIGTCDVLLALSMCYRPEDVFDWKEVVIGVCDILLALSIC
jgi:hypothetical protein